MRVRVCVCVCVCVLQRAKSRAPETVCVCVCVHACVLQRAKSVCVCVCVCVCMLQRAKSRAPETGVCVCVHACVCVCVCVCVCYREQKVELLRLLTAKFSQTETSYGISIFTVRIHKAFRINCACRRRPGCKAFICDVTWSELSRRFGERLQNKEQKTALRDWGIKVIWRNEAK